MNLQVLPLRVLVSRQVIRDRMDYTGYLAGETRSEMDKLDKLAGRFVVQASELTVERFLGGEKLPADEWERKRSEVRGSFFLNFLDGTEEISIVEKSSSGARGWVISDVDGVTKGFPLTSSGRMFEDNSYVHSDYFVEDGALIIAQKTFMMDRNKSALDFWGIGPLDQCLIMDYLDSFSTDKQGNLVRKFIYSMPMANIKITKVMSAIRVPVSEKPLQRGNIVVRKVFAKIRKVFARE